MCNCLIVLSISDGYLHEFQYGIIEHHFLTKGETGDKMKSEKNDFKQSHMAPMAMPI